MQLKPVAVRTNWPLIAAFIVWVAGILLLPYSNTAYFAFTAAAIVLMLSQVVLNVRVRRA